MVSVGSILAMIFTLTAAFFLPIIGAVVLCAAGRLSWRSLITGFFFYAVLQALFRLPVLWLLYKIPAVQSFAYSLVGNALLMAITTAFFETAARFLGGRLVLGRKGRSITPGDSIGYGLGHSIAETFFLMGLSYFGNLMLAFALNQNGLSNYSEVFGQEAAVQVYQVLTGTPALEFAAGGVERIFYTIIQIVLTGLVFHGLRRRSMKPVLLAALAHFLTVFGTAILQPHGVWVGEVYIFLMAMVLLLGPAPMLWPRRKAPVIPEGMEELSAPEEMAEIEKTEATEAEETQEEAEPQPSPEEK